MNAILSALIELEDVAERFASGENVTPHPTLKIARMAIAKAKAAPDLLDVCNGLADEIARCGVVVSPELQEQLFQAIEANTDNQI
jgi:hypothetical protein